MPGVEFPSEEFLQTIGDHRRSRTCALRQQYEESSRWIGRSGLAVSSMSTYIFADVELAIYYLAASARMPCCIPKCVLVRLEDGCE